MKKRLLGMFGFTSIIFFLNVGLVSANVDFSKIDLVPTPVYELLKKLLTNVPDEVFIKFLFWIVAFSLFYFSLSQVFPKDKRIANVLAIVLSLITIIFLPSQFLVQMAKLYASVFGILIPLALVYGVLKFSRLEELKDHHGTKALLYFTLVIICVLLLTISQNTAKDLPFITLMTNAIPLVMLFFLAMTLIELLEFATSLAGSHSGTGLGGSSSPARRVVNAEDAELRDAERLAAIEPVIDRKLKVDLESIENEDLLELDELTKLRVLITGTINLINQATSYTSTEELKRAWSSIFSYWERITLLTRKLFEQYGDESKLLKESVNLDGEELRLFEHVQEDIKKANELITRPLPKNIPKDLYESYRPKFKNLIDELINQIKLVMDVNFKLNGVYKNHTSAIKLELDKLKDLVGQGSLRFKSPAYTGAFGAFGGLRTVAVELLQIILDLQNKFKIEFENITKIRREVQEEIDKFHQIYYELDALRKKFELEMSNSS